MPKIHAMTAAVEPTEHSPSPLVWHRFEPEKDLILSFAPRPLAGSYRYGVARITRAIDAAETDSGEKIATILKAATTHEALADLVRDALSYAERTRIDAKIRSYGRAIARGYLATDDSDIDTERFIARTVDRLEQPHINAIELIADWEQPATVNAETDSVDHLLTKELGTEPGRLITRQLANEGILGGETETVDGNTVFFGLSDFGHRVHEHLIARADD
jgi:hypothetical protein